MLHKHSFTLPAYYLRVLSVVEKGETIDYLIEGRSLLANVSSIKLRYVFQNTDISTYDAMLVNLLELAMANKLAYAITQSSSLAQYRLQEYQMALRTAKSLNGLECPADVLGHSPLLESRLNG